MKRAGSQVATTPKRRTHKQDDGIDVADDNATIAETPAEKTLEAESEIESDSDEEVIEDEDEPTMDEKLRIWRPGKDAIGQDEELVHDPSAYDTFHKFELTHSCLSLDLLPDQLGSRRETGPHTLYLVAGSQALARSDNHLYVVKCSNVRRTWKLDDDEESDVSDDEDENPVFAHSHIKVDFGVNHVRVMPQARQIVAAWGDDAKVHVYNVQAHLDVLDSPATSLADPRQAAHFTHAGHKDEGFALAWNVNAVGELLTGSRDQQCHLLQPAEASWRLGRTFEGHTGSVEGVSWKVDDGCVFASGSADGSIRIWDTRVAGAQTVVSNAHDGDVNVVAFRPMEERSHLLSGGDDGQILLRDVRFPDQPLFRGRAHRDAVNVLDWHPEDSCTFLAAGYDDAISIWGLDVEPEAAQGQDIQLDDTFPEQLMFLHMGQRHIAAARWHPQISNLVVSTAEDGFHIFRPENLMPDTTCA